ncbi:hypothetical protein HDU96_007122 [Phlyctochytrium bullatum]|nr:hypothetical protein HDU96_007122 [Phlyctochytrium bullatum]
MPTTDVNVKNLSLIIYVHFPNQPDSHAQFYMNSRIPFDVVIAELASKIYNCPTKDVVLAVRDVEVSPFATPHSLTGGAGSLTIGLLAAKEKENAQRLEHLAKETQDSEIISPAAVTPLLNLTMKDKEKETLNVKVYPKTTIDDIITLWSNAKSVPKNRIRLQFDGDTLENDSLVAEYDLEDGDSIEVRYTKK